MNKSYNLNSHFLLDLAEEKQAPVKSGHAEMQYYYIPQRSVTKQSHNNAIKLIY
jgi:hypothetical protein